MTTTVRRRQTLASGVVLTVVHGDLTQEHVDALVNAANGRLAHGGGVAAAIAERAGPELQRESDAWVALHGRIPDGGVGYTFAWDGRVE